MPIAINGSGTITGISAGGLPDGVITTDDIAASAITRAKIGYAGAILQVVTTNKTDTFTTSSTSYADVTGLSVTITPSSSASNIIVSLSMCFSGDNTTNAYVRLVRGSTAIAIGDANGSRIRFTMSNYQGSASSNFAPTSGVLFLDSPATTSATTYKVQMQNQGTGTVYVNRSPTYTDSSSSGTGISIITVMEVAA
jgi:hypothetical protein